MDRAEIIKWADDTVAAKGAKFTPLSKDAQFAIAEFVLACVKELQSEVVETKQPEQDMEGVPSESPKAEVQEPIPDMEGVPAPTFEEVKGMATKFVRRGDHLQKCGKDAQAAYDEFLKWANDNPRDSFVMDFATGEKNPGAAFAYWLNDLIEVAV